ncbi:hypothetical protein L7F22_066960 [Adiantum nelumboides]|nr:hypothetical protein [Adiantum nelumboides]
MLSSRCCRRPTGGLYPNKTLAKRKEKGQEQGKEHDVNAHAVTEEGEPSKKPWNEDTPELSSPSYSPPTSFSYSSDSSSSSNPRRRRDPDKSLEVMRKFSEQYARRSDTYFCMDKGVTAVVIKGLAEHKDTLGAPLCPCRHYDDKVAEVEQGFWNCPCVPMRERKECHCMLFLTKENDFAGEDQAIGLTEIKDLTANF